MKPQRSQTDCVRTKNFSHRAHSGFIFIKSAGTEFLKYYTKIFPISGIFLYKKINYNNFVNSVGFVRDLLHSLSVVSVVYTI